MPKSLTQQLRDIFSGRSLSSQPFDDDDLEDSIADVQHWVDDIQDIQSLFPANFARANSSDMRYEITGLDDAVITARCKVRGAEYRLFLDRYDDVPVGCGCKVSRNEMPCVHGYNFTKYLLQQLRDSNSRLTQSIMQAKQDSFSTTQPQLVHDPLANYRFFLTKVSDSISRLTPDNSPTLELPVAKKAEIGRIAWNVVYRSGEAIEINPVYQTAKKRGGGWTKGKQVSLERLQGHSTVFSPSDQRVFSKIEVDNDYYRSLELNPVDAAIELIGAPNVLINNEPGTIEAGALMVTYQESSEACELCVGNPNSFSCLCSDGYLEIDKEKRVLQVCRLTETQSSCVETIYSLRPVPLDLREQVIQLARQLQSHLTVNLPAEIAGPLVHDVARPLLLLMLDEQGGLSYGNRVRLASGRVAKPGQGVLVVPEIQDGKPIQLERGHHNEIAMWHQLNEKIGFPQGETEGRLTDFETVMQVLQKVRELEADEQKLEVLWDQKSQKPLRLLGSVTPASLRVGVQKSRDWLQLNGECDFGGDEKMELATLLRSLRNLDASSIQGNYVKLGDHGWAKISEALRKQLNKLDDSVNEDRKKLVFDASSAQVIQDLSKLHIQVDGTAAWTQCLERIERASRIVPKLPTGLNAQLRDYQHEGYCWMRRLAEWGVGGVLADDMGLGKTLQTLAVLLDRIDSGPALVIAPTSVGFNWVREAEKFTPALKAQLYRETDRDDFLSNVGPGTIVVCSYGLALRDADKLSKIDWGTLVLDEAQAIKNARSKTAVAISEIKADWKVALTGTPVENHLGELWSIFHAVAPGVFGGWEQFRKRFAAPIEKDGDDERRLALRERIQPFVLRRTKAEVLRDLPARTEMNLYVDLSPDERVAYDRIRLSAVGELDAIAKLDDIQDQRFKMLALLTRLRQLACSPKLVHEDWPGRSAKLQVLAETVQELRQEGHRALIFSQFVTHLQLIRQMLVEEGISFEYMDGSTTPTERQKRVDKFQNGSSDVFLISLKAGGTGLNLTAADYVIHTDPWWNPAVEDQATDRAHRIGQDKPVMVYRLISKGTIEEEILKLHDSKRDLVAGVLDGSHTAAKLSTSDLIELIRGAN
jgi:superfamily II DNA or RNA helicase